MEKVIDINSDVRFQIKHAPIGWFVHLNVSTNKCDWKNTFKCYSPANPSIKWVNVAVMGKSETSEEDAIKDLRKEIARQIKTLEKKTDPRISMIKRLELLKSLNF